jgi:hypothetical protein
MQCVWEPTAFILRCQTAYGDFFGLRTLISRSLVPATLSAKAGLLARARPRWAHRREGENRKVIKGRKFRRAEWEKATRSLTKAMRSEASSTKQTIARETLLDLENAPEPDITRAVSHIEKRLQSDEAAHAKSEATMGLAPPPGPVRVNAVLPKAASVAARAKATVARNKKKAAVARKVVGSPGSKRKAVTLDASPPNSKARCVVWDLTGDEFENQLKCSAASLEARLQGHTVRSRETAGRSQIVQFLAVSQPLRIYFTVATRAKHNRCHALLSQAGLVIATIPPLGENSRWVCAGAKDPERPALVKLMGGMSPWTMSQLCQSLGS